MAEDQVEPATGNVLDNDLAGDGSAAAGWAVVAIDDSADQVGQPLAGAFGTLTVHADGSYSHTVDNDRPEVQALRAGETLTETHTYTALDAAGEPVTGTLTLTITGTNDAPVIAGEAVWLDLVAPASEPAEPEADAAAPGELVEVGQFDFTDVDLGDVHTLEDPVAPEGALGALTIELLADTAAGGTQEPADGAPGAIAWTYRVSAQALAHLAEGETVTETYTFALLDDQGGRVEQQVTVSLTGTNDAPFIAVDDPQLVVDASLTEADAPLSAQGRLVFGDVDAADSAAGADAALAPWCEVVDQILLSDSVALTPGQELALLAGFQGIDAATGEWAYAIDSPDFLPEGSEVSAVYTVRVMDGHGAFVDQAVSVTIRGSNDAPVIVGAPLLGREGVELTVSDADNGTELAFQIGDTVLDPTASPVTNALDWPDADPTRFVPVEQVDAVLSGVLLVTDGLAAVDTGLAVVLGRAGADELVAPGVDGDDGGDDGGGRPTALWGFGGRDTLVGGAGDDRLDGGDGNDVLEGGAGWDLLIGGAGRDTFDIRAQGDGSADYVTDLSDRDRLIVADGGSVDADLVADLQPGDDGHGYVATRRGLVVDGEARLYNTGGFTVDLSAASGSRGVYLEDESGHGAAMTGTARADTLVGGAGADTLAGGGGADLLVGGMLAQPDDGRLGAADTFVIDGDDTVQDLSGTDVLIVRRGASLVAHVTGDYTAGAGSTVEGDGDAWQGDDHGHDNDRGSDHDHDHDSRADGESDRGDADGHGDGPAERDGDRGEDDRSDDGRADPRSDAGGDAVRPAALTLLSDGHDVDLSAVTSRDGRGLRIENTAADGRGVDGDPTEGPSGVTFVGSAGDDTLVGGALGDVLAGGAGADRIYGSAAVAQGVAAIEAVIAADRDRAAEPGDRGDRGEPGDRATTSDAETWARHVAAALADGVDDRTGADPLALDEIDGGAGDDRIVAGNGSAWVHGGRGDDVIVAGQGPSVLAGDAGNDLIVAGDARVAGAAEGDEAFDATQGASPVLVAGHVIDGGAGDDTVHSGAGDDAVFGGRGDDRLFGDAGADWLDGDVGRDTLQGGDGDDRLDGGAQADRLVGGAGDDLYVVDDAGDAVVERAGAGSDTVLASVSWQLDAEVENLTLTGSADLDGTGNRQANALIGNTGANRLSGGGGADFLTGGGGADVLSGGAGSDVFVFGAGDSAFTIGIDTGHDGDRRGRASGEVRGQDVITDFTLGGGDGGRGGHEGHGGQDGAGDRLDTGGRAHVAADTGGAVDGVDSTLTVGRQAVGSHAIHDGVAVFNGGDVRIASQGDLAAVVQYLQANPLGDAGTTVAFTGRIDGVAHTWVYTQGDAAAEGDVSHDGLVDLVGVRADGLTQDPTHAPGSYIVIS